RKPYASLHALASDPEGVGSGGQQPSVAAAAAMDARHAVQQREQGSPAGPGRRVLGRCGQLQGAGVLAAEGGLRLGGAQGTQALAVAPRGGQRAVVDESVRGGSGTAGGDGRVPHDSTVPGRRGPSRPPGSATVSSPW